jgi:hypothetical protein
LAAGFLLALAAGQGATFNIGNGDVAGLIAAIQTANTNGEVNVINLAPNGLYVLMAVEENPPEYNNPGAVGLPVIRGQVTINGNGATIQRSTAPGTPNFVPLAVSGRTASCGDASCFSHPSLTLSQTTLTGGSLGGLHLNSATALIQSSTITQNTGGGINNACGNLTLLNSTVSYNTSGDAYGGGGIFLWNFSCAPGTPTANISFSTIFENQNTSGTNAQGESYGPGYALTAAFGNPGAVIVKNSILASPSRAFYPAAACNGTLPISMGNNIVGDTSCGFTGPGDLINTNPLLGPAANNGGPTLTDLPAAGSPAIDAVPLSSCSDVSGNTVTTDQRGIARPQGSACDIGSVEVVQGPKYQTCLLYNSTKAVNSGAVDPIKLDLCDASGNDLSSSAIALHATSVTQVSTSISGVVQDAGNANPDNDFRFDATLGTTGGYIFNLSTKGLSTGTYVLNFLVTGDTFVYAASFQVK